MIITGQGSLGAGGVIFESCLPKACGIMPACMRLHRINVMHLLGEAVLLTWQMQLNVKMQLHYVIDGKIHTD